MNTNEILYAGPKPGAISETASGLTAAQLVGVIQFPTMSPMLTRQDFSKVTCNEQP